MSLRQGTGLRSNWSIKLASQFRVSRTKLNFLTVPQSTALLTHKARQELTA